VEPLVGALKDPDIDVRVAAAWALGQIESSLALEPLRAAQQDASSTVRRAATWALRQIDDDDNPRVRVHVRPRVKIKS
jgi:HEAT repeat protein